MADDFDPYYKWLSIPPAEQPPSHYRLLGVPEFEDDAEVISNAADSRMMMIRSFQTGKHAEISQQILNQISLARLALLNEEKKRVYDDQLREQKATPAPPPPPPAELVVPPPLDSEQTQPAVDLNTTVDVNTTSDLNTTSGIAMRRRPAGHAEVRRSASRRKQPPFVPMAIAAAGVVVLIGLLGIGLLNGSRDQPRADRPQADLPIRGTPRRVPDQGITPAPPAEPLRLITIGPKSVPAGAIIRWVVTATGTGARSFAVHYSLVQGPPGARVDDRAGTFTWQTVQGDAETSHQVKIRAANSATGAAAESEFQVQVQSSDGPVDLLSLVDPTHDSVKGAWFKQGSTLVSGRAKPALIRVPYAPPEDYELRMVVERRRGNDALAIGLVAGGRPCNVVFDRWPSEGWINGIELIDGQRIASNETRVLGRMIRPDQRETFRFTVGGDKIEVFRGDERKIDLEGFDRLSRCPDWATPEARLLSLGTWDAEIRIVSLELTPRPGQRSIAPLESPLTPADPPLTGIPVPLTPELLTPEPLTPEPTPETDP